MFTLYWIAFAPARNPNRIGPLFTYKNSDFGAISVTEQSRTALISKVVSHISDRCSCHTGQLFVVPRKSYRIGPLNTHKNGCGGTILDGKTVGFFLKISKEIGNAWRKSLIRANRASLTRP